MTPLRSVNFLSDSDETDEEGAAYRRLRIDSDDVSYWEDILMSDFSNSELAANHKVLLGFVGRYKMKSGSDSIPFLCFFW